MTDGTGWFYDKDYIDGLSGTYATQTSLGSEATTRSTADATNATAISNEITRATTTEAGKAPISAAWVTVTAYRAGELATNANLIYQAIDNHTSGATFAGDSAAHWTLVSGVLTDTGALVQWTNNTVAAAGTVWAYLGATYCRRTTGTDSTFTRANWTELGLDPTTAAPLAQSGQTPAQEPVPLGASALVGTLTEAARADHVHPRTGLLTSVPIQFPIRANTYYLFTDGGSGGITNSFGGAGGIYLPILLTRSVTVSKVGLLIDAAGSAATILRFGFYADNGSGQPGALLSDAGTIATGAGTGYQEIAGLSQALPSGLSWVCVVIQGAPATTPGIRTTIPSPWPGLIGGATAFQRYNCYVSGSGWIGSTGGLPSTAFITSSSTAGPAISLMYSAVGA